jgi:hypothetical protein
MDQLQRVTGMTGAYPGGAVDRYRTYPNRDEIAFARMRVGKDLVREATFGLQEISQATNQVTDNDPGLLQPCREFEYVYKEGAKHIIARAMLGGS